MIFSKIKEQIQEKVYSYVPAVQEINEIAGYVVEALSEKLENQIDFFMDYNAQSYSGISSNLWNNETHIISVGVKDLLFPQNSEQSFVNATIVIFHEAHHLEQLIDIKAGAADERIMYAHLAKHDPAFYIRNYTLFYDELDADRAGILNAYQYLSETHPEMDVMSCIKNYMKQKGGIYSGHEKEIEVISDLKDIKHFFEEREVWLSKQLKTADILEPDSPFKKFLNQLEQEFEYTNGWSIYIANCDNNLDCDKFVSYIILKQHPEYILNYPQKQQQMLNQLPEPVTIEETKEEHEI